MTEDRARRLLSNLTIRKHFAATILGVSMPTLSKAIELGEFETFTVAGKEVLKSASVAKKIGLSP